LSDALIHALPIGHEFDGYRILRILGVGGFGVTYLAEEVRLGRKVAIKEYLPRSIAGREIASTNVRPLAAGLCDQFAWGLDRFRQEAMTLVNFEHPNIVGVHRYAEANGTAYLVMQYVEGKPLDALLAGGKTLDESEIEEVILPILAGLEQVHAANFLHRDIKPANIYIRMDGRPVLLDFGAARQAFQGQDKSVTAIVSEGYAPFEQYEGRGDQGPWTDIYAIGAVLYRCIAGDRPPPAPERISARLRQAPDPMRPAREAGMGRYSARLLEAVDLALGLTRAERPQTVAELRRLLESGEAEKEGPARAAVPAPPMPPAEEIPRAGGIRAGIARVMIALSRLPPPLTLFVLVLLGMLVNGVSLFIGVGNFEYTLALDGATLRKEVGFLSALNWSLGCLVISPAIVAFGLYTYRQLPRIFEQLAKRHMIVDENLKPVDAAAIQQQWRRYGRTIAILSAAAFAVAVAYSLWEYYYVVGQHYLRGGFPPDVRLTDAYQERDWSVAALLGAAESPGISRIANAAFALFVYVLYAGLTSGFVFSIYAYLIGIAVFVYALAYREQGLRLVPDVSGGEAAYDRRAGLQVFEPLVQNALFVTLLSFLMLFLIHLQNVYLRVPVPSVFEFAFPNAGDGGKGWVGFLESLAGAVTARAGLANLNSALAYGFGSFLFLLVLAMLAATLRLAAQRSRQRLFDALSSDDAPLPPWLAPLGREKCLARLEAMSMWPARWPRVNQLALASVVAAICLVFYKVGLIVVALGLMLVCVRLFSARAALAR
jgi:serine/threonine protein kinase